jgi:hypothetical protein
LRFDFSLPPAYLHQFEQALVIWVTVKILMFRVAKLDCGLWRCVTVVDLKRIGIANLTAESISYILIRLIASPGFPDPSRYSIF